VPGDTDTKDAGKTVRVSVPLAVIESALSASFSSVSVADVIFAGARRVVGLDPFIVAHQIAARMAILSQVMLASEKLVKVTKSIGLVSTSMARRLLDAYKDYDLFIAMLPADTRAFLPEPNLLIVKELIDAGLGQVLVQLLSVPDGTNIMVKAVTDAAKEIKARNDSDIARMKVNPVAPSSASSSEIESAYFFLLGDSGVVSWTDHR